MAKKYYKSMRKREAYTGYDQRRRMEYEDSMMIHEDRSAMSNLPQQVMIKPYPQTLYHGDPALDDTARGVDHQMDSDLRGGSIKRSRYPEKF